MVEYVSVSDRIPLIGEMSQHQRAGRCLAEEAALRFWPFAAIGESVVRGHVAAERVPSSILSDRMCREDEAEGT